MASNSNISSMRRLVEQLKLEASVERIKVSQAAAELQQYCLQNAENPAPAPSCELRLLLKKDDNDSGVSTVCLF
uniref:Guanine nucleotide-binding protein subunit gamma n=1 Tax=Knipowitschia caucasica TaxID=637954 RepID=A0AAV2IR56_KNICA